MYVMRITVIRFVMKHYDQGEYLKADGLAISVDSEKKSEDNDECFYLIFKSYLFDLFPSCLFLCVSCLQCKSSEVWFLG